MNTFGKFTTMCFVTLLLFSYTALAFDRVILLNAEQSPTGVLRKYALTKNENEEKTTYTIHLNIKFKWENRELKQHWEGAFENRFNVCTTNTLERVKLFESERTRLLLKVHRSNARLSAVEHTFNIYEVVDRENMISLSVKSSCATLIHELMHVTGLVDLYTDDQYKTIRKFMGIAGATPNLMADAQKLDGKEAQRYSLTGLPVRYYQYKGNLLFPSQALDIINGDIFLRELEDYYTCSSFAYYGWFGPKDLKLFLSDNYPNMGLGFSEDTCRKAFLGEFLNI